MDSAAHRRLLLVASVVLFAGVFAAFSVGERPGLGLGHLYYVPVALAAVAGGPWLGMWAGVLGTVLYNAGLVLNPHLPSTMQGAQTSIRLVTFVAVGVLVGTFAHTNRKLVAELTRLAERDRLTGLPNTRAFESAIARRLERDTPFALVVGDVDELRRTNSAGEEHGDELLRRLTDRLLNARHRDDDVARIGGDEFAILAARPPAGARELALELERQFEGPDGTMTFGWAAFPQDADNALGLYRVADERLYARKIARGFRRPLDPAGLDPVGLDPVGVA